MNVSAGVSACLCYDPRSASVRHNSYAEEQVDYAWFIALFTLSAPCTMVRRLERCVDHRKIINE